MISPSAWLERLQHELEVARAGEDPEGVHQMRVAAGRLRVWLELGDRRALVDDLRWLRRSAAPVRDLDVLIAENSDPECTIWLAERREASRGELLAALDDERIGALLVALESLPALPRERAKRSLPRLLHRVLRAGEHIEQDPRNLSAWHTLRRALRKLRYGREWLDEDTGAIHEYLDVLGELNNAVVERRHLAECRSSHATETLSAVERKIEKQRAAASEGWSDLRARLKAY